jgi:ribulose-5-phosphate 4-epimerase/fuculose-1-phosphate aldolase
MKNLDRSAYDQPQIRALREDLALALRAAAHHGLGEGVCNHFSIALPEDPTKFLLNPRGLMWKEVRADDIVLVNSEGARLAGQYEIEPSAMFIHAAVHRITKKNVVLHSHCPYATALSLTKQGALDTTLSQNAMRYFGRVAVDRHYNGLALDQIEGERIANALNGADVAFLANHGVIVCGDRLDYAYDDLYYLERACQAEVIARSSQLPMNPVPAELSAVTGAQIQGERTQSELFFKALRRVLV